MFAAATAGNMYRITCGSRAVTVDMTFCPAVAIRAERYQRVVRPGGSAWPDGRAVAYPVLKDRVSATLVVNWSS